MLIKNEITKHEKLSTLQEKFGQGNPLTLSEVLKAIGNKYLFDNDSCVDNEGNFYVAIEIGKKVSGSIKISFSRFIWNLDHDLLLDQNKDTIDSIYSLLNND